MLITPDTLITPKTPVNIRHYHSVQSDILGRAEIGMVFHVDDSTLLTYGDYQWIQIDEGPYANAWVAYNRIGEMSFWQIVPTPEPCPEPEPCPDPEPYPYLVLVNDWAELDRNQFSWDSVKLVKVVGQDIIFDLAFIEGDDIINAFLIAEGGDLSEVKITLREAAE